MTDTYVSYAPGSWTLVARGGRFLLLEAGTAEPAISTLWTSMESGDLGAVLGTLAADLPEAGFCLVDVTGQRVQVAQHGVNALLDGRPIGTDRTPRDVAVPEIGGMITVATGSAAGEARLPIEGGVVGAGTLLVVRVATEGPATVALDDLPVKMPEDVLEDVPELAVPRAQSPAPAANLWDDVPEFDESAADAPVAELAGPVGRPPSGVGAALLDAPPPQVAPVPETSAPISDGTVTGATVLAGYCLNGHISGAYAPTCRICGEAMPQQTPRTVPRPSLGVLVLANDDEFDLETGAILGRAPRVPDDAIETPLLVSLAAYGRDISRQHAEVVVHGWNVFVRDLGSANGTRVREPDGQVITLEPHVAVPLAPGSVLEIAEVTSVRYRIA
jgi:hypothetical protein